MIERVAVLGVAFAGQAGQIANQGVAIGVDEARQAVGEPRIEHAIAGEESLIEQADVEFRIPVVHLAAFGRRAHRVAHAQSGIPEMLQEGRNRGLTLHRLPLGGEEQQNVDIGVRKELPPAIPAHGEHRNLTATEGNSSVEAVSRTRRSTWAVRSASAAIASPLETNSSRMREGLPSEGRFAVIIVSDPDRFGDIEDEDLPVANLARARGGGQCLDDFVGARSDGTTSSTFTLGSRSTLYSCPR